MKGKELPVLAYELLGLRGQVAPEVEEMVQVYSDGLARYREQKWDQAIERFAEVQRSARAISRAGS